MRKRAFLVFLQIAVTVLLASLLGLFIRKDFVRFKEFLAANPIVSGLKIDQGQVKNKAMMVTINHSRPDMTMWQDFIVDGKTPEESFLNDSVRYYEVIGSYVPNIAEPQHMLALCYGLLGNEAAAVTAQEKAVAMEPRFFWSWYNLGMLYYRQKDFAKSAQAFRKALAVPPQVTVKIMGNSKVYGEVLRGGQVQADAAQHLQQGYRDAAKMLEASVLRLPGQPVAVTESEMSLKLF